MEKDNHQEIEEKQLDNKNNDFLNKFNEKNTLNDTETKEGSQIQENLIASQETCEDLTKNLEKSENNTKISETKENLHQNSVTESLPSTLNTEVPIKKVDDENLQQTSGSELIQQNPEIDQDLQPDLPKKTKEEYIQEYQEILDKISDLKGNPNEFCMTCGCIAKENKKINACAGCKSVYYCSVDHQKKNWDIHKGVCSVLKKGAVTKENVLNSRSEDLLRIFENARKDTMFDRLLRIKLIGEGNFSEIFLVKDPVDDKEYALKVIEKGKLSRMRKEKDVLMEKHCLIKLKDVDDVINIIETHKDEYNLYLLVEAVKKCELFEECTIFGFIPRVVVQYWFLLILNAVEKIHRVGIVHRDLKPENIMITEDYTIRLIDFGTAWDLKEPHIKGAGNGSTGRKIYDHFIGTPNYMSIESIHNKGSFEATDIYSLGVTLYQLILGFTPFTAESEYIIFTQAKNLDPMFYEGIFWEEAEDLILKMMAKDHNDRPTVSEIKQHKFFDKLDPHKPVPKYEEISCMISEEEKCFMELQTSLRERSETFDEKFEMVQKKYQENEADLKKLNSRIEIYKKQAKHSRKEITFEHPYDFEIDDYRKKN